MFLSIINALVAIIAIIILFICGVQGTTGGKAKRQVLNQRSKPPYMTFPREEWDDIQKALDERGECSTTRVQYELAKWRDFPLHTRLESDVGPIKLIEIRLLDDALEDHPYADSIRKHPKWVAQIKGRPGAFIRFERATDDTKK